MTRKQQVIDRLLAADGRWVNGSELATEAVGGSEGLKRLREARAEGWPIEEQHHPDRSRTVWQYRLLADHKGVPSDGAALDLARVPAAAIADVQPVVAPPRCPGTKDKPCGAAMLPSGSLAAPGFMVARCPYHGRISIRWP